jgi:hypothetical protein
MGTRLSVSVTIGVLESLSNLFIVIPCAVPVPVALFGLRSERCEPLGRLCPERVEVERRDVKHTAVRSSWPITYPMPSPCKSPIIRIIPLLCLGRITGLFFAFMLNLLCLFPSEMELCQSSSTSSASTSLSHSSSLS